VQNLDEKEVMRLWECSAEDARWLLDLQAEYPHIDLLLSEGVERPDVHVFPTMEACRRNPKYAAIFEEE
jgi:hypothetical protein